MHHGVKKATEEFRNTQFLPLAVSRGPRILTMAEEVSKKLVVLRPNQKYVRTHDAFLSERKKIFLALALQRLRNWRTQYHVY